ncbi:cytochrome P450 6j1-like [Leguminivora glycinivorella]|uniref:cytochrome P450 6j1-like n=1 Tax=Leguminivora glycinivorella TaxID=1035111 RepID=UPI0020102860|nr:cytochrome P450 6j1-like [Leguminivora glycinivorella]
MWLYIALGLLALAYLVFKSCKYDYWEKKGIPTASGNEWFFGHFKQIVLLKKHLVDVIETIYKEFPDAPLVGYYSMNVPTLMVKDLDIIKTIVVSEFSSFNSAGIKFDRKADPLAAAHPFFQSGEEWKTTRAQVTPSLTLAKLRGYLPNIFKVADVMINHVKRSKSKEIETRDLAMRYGTDVIGNAIYGIENNSFENDDSLVSHLTREIKFESSIKNNIKLFFQNLPIISWFFPQRLATLNLQHMMLAMTRKIVKQRIETGEKRNDLIQLLLTQKENDTKGVITDEYMSGQVFVFIIDLFETGSNAISMLLYILSIHPDIQDRLRAEIKEIKARNKGEFTAEDIEGAKYLEMVYNESLRIFSFFLTRECTNDCLLPVPGSEPFKITKGTSIVIPVASIQKDPKYYPDPEKFDPERFTEEEVAKRPKFTYMPFGEGPKKCIGARMVTLHIKIAIIKILDNFKLVPSSKTKYPFEIDPRFTLTFRPVGGSWVKFEPIN